MTEPHREFCTRIGYQFRDQGLLTRALTHRSHGADNNERLEFLGDSLLNLIIAEALFVQFGKMKEGDLSRVRAELVKGNTLAELAAELDFGSQLVLGVGERNSGGHRRNSILADAVEAVIAAIYLDSDFDTCKARVLSWFSGRLSRLSPSIDFKDPKTRLQERLQAKGLPLPEYTLVETEGAEHRQIFTVSCKVSPLEHAVEANGPSRRRAEQAAAEQVLQQLETIE